LLIAEEAIEDIAAGDPGRGKVGIDGERFVVGGLCFVYTAELIEKVAAA
jgi:hypothetical protein